MNPQLHALRLVARVLLGAGCLSLGYGAYVVSSAKAYQAIEMRRFEETKEHVAPTPALSEGVSIGEIQIPRLGLTALGSRATRRRFFGTRSGTSRTRRCPANRETSCWRVTATPSSGR